MSRVDGEDDNVDRGVRRSCGGQGDASEERRILGQEEQESLGLTPTSSRLMSSQPGGDMTRCHVSNVKLSRCLAQQVSKDMRRRGPQRGSLIRQADVPVLTGETGPGFLRKQRTCGSNGRLEEGERDGDGRACARYHLAEEASTEGVEAGTDERRRGARLVVTQFLQVAKAMTSVSERESDNGTIRSVGGGGEGTVDGDGPVVRVVQVSLEEETKELAKPTTVDDNPLTVQDGREDRRHCDARGGSVLSDLLELNVDEVAEDDGVRLVDGQ